jgi:hypothetical protein
MDKLGIKPPENEATVLDNITDFVSGLFGKDKEEVKTKTLQTKPESEPITSSSAFPTGRLPVDTPPTAPVRGGRGTITEKPGEREAARKAAADKRKKKQREKTKENIRKTSDRLDKASGAPGSKSVREKAGITFRKADNPRGFTGGFDKGGLMNKKGKKK